MSTTYTQAELSAKTVKDLKAILSELKLSQDGKKADLVTRIIEHQGGSSNGGGASAGDNSSKAGASSEGGAASTTAAVEEVTAGNATATGGVAAPAQSNSSNTTANATTEEKEEVKKMEESLPLPAASSKDEEAEKRINRLKRFGNPDDIAKLERAEKFGSQVDAVDEKSISRLDSELSNKRQRKDKAGTSAAANGKPSSPQKNGNAKQGQQEGGRPGLNRAKSNGGGKAAAGGKGGAAAAKSAPPALSPEEEEKRRKRAERFNAAS